ncbi:CAP domain-containing protein [Mycobacterium intracellulare]|uniref:CAP domain-containing protein n=1 Tax=Mycobacterium intracellulare TaxID=1767 RepID=A0AAE4RAX4_MYCIT|nr:CAP domain-containing protein [Mycobacterium intracellulare]MCA2318748.1 CAP domain-containing protein [Mycobacterium intracellulare]MCA2338947.1 CAP domain-containing protein [Mycobacterium intracellulare]MDV6975405.1 CAP domain-containing protein [Mycobacterium intracellulare]MDV6980469.1 CAP domain-containing protein [Mycobacterium intracellulare]MDV7010898.1 CAP domain-containing protein [Mycobacterium intracellulare]
MSVPIRRPARALSAAVLLAGAATLVAPAAHADNKRLNSAVVSAVYTLQHQAGCTNDVVRNNALTLAAEWHAEDMITNRNINGDTGSDGSTPQDRANAAGFRGRAAETVAINPAIAISSLELVNQWYYNPDDMAIIRDCANTAIGVWSANSVDRTVVVAVYGQPDPPRR